MGSFRLQINALVSEGAGTVAASIGGGGRVAANSLLNQAIAALEMAAKRTNGVETFLTHDHNRAGMAAQYVEAYRRYCWQVESLADLKLAPFHILATEGEVHNDKSHV